MLEKVSVVTTWLFLLSISPEEGSLVPFFFSTYNITRISHNHINMEGYTNTIASQFQYPSFQATHTSGDIETFARKLQVLDNWCAEIGRNPREIERSTGTQRFANDAQRDAFVKAGATHLILEIGEPWDFKAVKDLVRWRDKQRFISDQARDQIVETKGA